MKSKIYFINDKDSIIISNEDSFHNFIIELFKEKIFLSSPEDDSDSIALNTENITYVWEV